MPVTQFQTMLQRVRCEGWLRCDVRNDPLRPIASSVSECVEVISRRPDGAVDDLLRLVAAGVVRYDPVAAGRCAAAAATSCAFSWSVAAACADVFTGTVATGGSCRRDEECAGDAWCDLRVEGGGTSCPGACRPRLPLGSSCASVGVGICSRRGVEGWVRCGDGDLSTEPRCGEVRHGAPVGEGAPCGVTRVHDTLARDIQCAPGLACPREATELPPAQRPPRTCVRLALRGMPCTAAVGCWQSQCLAAPDLRSATCEDLLVRSRVGDPCASIDGRGFVACNAYARLACSATSVCELVTDGREGSRCGVLPSTPYDCNAGLYCDGSTRRCLRKKADGAYCQTSEECESTCRASRCSRYCGSSTG